MLNLKDKKYIDFLSRFNHKAEYLEGTTQAGKTTVGSFKFILAVKQSEVKQHIIAGQDKGVIEKNIINADNGIMQIFKDELHIPIEYNGNGTGKESIPHLLLYPDTEKEKVIYCLGYGDKERWKKALGGQYGCLYIDEINTADIEFVREAVMRCDYLMATLNPDDPSLPVYDEYINHSRPLDIWKYETPEGILRELIKPVKDGWVHWFFSFDNNPALTKEKREQVISNVPVGTKLYKNKILGLRGRSTGLVFSNFDDDKILTDDFIKSEIDAGRLSFKRFTCGMDTSYSAKTHDTIAMLFAGITADNQIYVLREKIYNNAELKVPFAPSDIVLKLIEFLEQCRKEYGLCRNVFIDSADQATIVECKKYKRKNGSIYIFNDAYKGIKIIDRINHKLGWISHGQYFVSESCKEHIREMNMYSWKDDKDEPEDRNNHTIDAIDYAWMPYRREIGIEE